MSKKRMLASYKGPVKGLKPYLLSLMHANAVPFRQKKPAPRRTKEKLLSSSISRKEVEEK